MKKFISLVLALVMALSLTTVAWGATTHEVSTEAQLAELLDENGTNDVAEGDTIKLLNNIVVTTPMHTTNGVSYTGDKSFTIDFNNCIVSAGSSITNAVFRIKTSGTVTLKNGTITASDMFYAVLANGTGTINLDNMTISLTNTGGQGVAVNAYAGTVNVNDGTDITAAGAYAGMEVYGTANIYEGSTVSYLGDVPAPNTYGSIGSAVGTSGGGTLNIYGGELVSTATGGNTVATNTSGGTISIMGGTITGETAVYAYTDSSYGIPADVSIIGGTINGALKEEALGATSTEVVVKGGTFDDADAKDYLADGATATIAGKTVFKNPGGGTVANPVAQVGNTKYETVAEAIAAAGANDVIVLLDTSATIPATHQSLKLTDGTSIVVPAVTSGDKFDLYQADSGMATALKLGAEDVAGLTFNEVGAKTNKDGSGRVAYIAANNGQFFVKTTNPTVADYAVTYAGKTDVLYYVYVGGTSAANFEYSEVVKAFDNWGKKCGQYDNTLFTKEQKADDYFMAANYKVYRAADAGVGTNYLLDGVVVSGVELGYTIDHNFVANNFKYDSATGTNVPTSAICTKCLMQSTAIYKIGKAPANSTVKPLSVDGVVSTVWEVVPVAASVGGTVVTPSTDKVTSADTFDAGIAMYVGMSVMAAAGSAVVIGKKKD